MAGPSRQALRSGARAGFAAVVLALLLALVAVASRAGIPWHSSPRAAPSPGAGRPSAGGATIVLAIALAAAAVAGLLRVRARLRHDRDPDAEAEARDAPWYDRVLVNALAVCLVAALVAAVLAFSHGGGARQQERRARADRSQSPARAPAATRPDYARWLPLAAGGALVLAGLGASALRRRERERPAPPSPGAVGAIVGRAIADLRFEPDPRRAVIAAYARMERGMSAVGLARDPADTSLEYLRRLLLAARADADAVRTLTRLFEGAKFGREQVDECARERAVAALATIQRDLERPA
jgi:Domain of unknown function (DUF4129)